MNKWILLLLASAFLFSGCAPKQRALDEGKHKELIAELTTQPENALTGDDFTVLCRAYYQSGDYSKFFNCTDRFREQFEHRKYSWIFNKRAAPRDVVGVNSAIESDLSAAYADLQQYKKSLKHAENALLFLKKIVDEASWLDDTASFIAMELEPPILELATLASLKLGKTSKSSSYIQRLKEIESYNSFYGSAVSWAMRDRSRLALMRIYLEMKKFVDAKKEWESMELSESGLNTAFNTVAMPFLAPIMLMSTGSLNPEKMADGALYNIRKELLIQISVAVIYAKTGEVEKSTIILDKALSHPLLSTFPSYYWVILYHRGMNHLIKGEILAAIENFKKSIEVLEAQRSTIIADAQKMGFAGDKQSVYSEVVSALVDQGHYDKAFSYAERGKARALVDMLASKQRFGGGDALNATEQNKLLTQLDTAESKARVASTVGELSTTRSVAIKKRTALSQQAPELSSLVTVDAPDVKEIQSLLPQDEILIEYYGSGDNLFAFVVTPKGIRGVKLDGQGLADDVTAFRAAILKPQGNAYQESGNRLYQRLIAPVASGIHTKNLTIVPHGALHYLPFSALTTDHGFMLDKYNIRILPSASVMKFLKSHKNNAGSLLALGNPDLGDAKYDLPFAQKEAIKVSCEIPGSKLLLRSAATETAVKKYGKGFRYLHFASHGTFDAEKPLQSGLLLAKDNQNDGMLTVGELYDLNLNADLVTLSACETALGKIANGDDVVGFTRGFLYAGASSIVSSLWQVDDAATSDLMTSFYDNLAKEDKRSALRDAQLLTKSKYHHPYYWAAFQITGAVQ